MKIRVHVPQWTPIRIEWVDSCNSDGRWRDTAEFDDMKVIHCVTVGMLVRQTKTETVVTMCAADIDGDDECAANFFAIPNVCISRIDELTVKGESPA